jgi:hypothetical protein
MAYGIGRGDLDALAGFEGEVVVLDLEGQLAREDEEELAGVASQGSSTCSLASLS